MHNNSLHGNRCGMWLDLKCSVSPAEASVSLLLHGRFVERPWLGEDENVTPAYIGAYFRYGAPSCVSIVTM